MRQALWLLGVAAAAQTLAVAGLGAGATEALGFGAVAAMAALISGTFLWLWWVRATPLAIGMALSWAGVALMAGGLAPRSGAGDTPLLLASLPLLVTGAVLHFAVMRSSMSLGRAAAAAPAALVAVTGLGVFFFTKS